MIINSEMYDWNDISIVPATLSEIDSRSQVNPYLKNGKLPIFTAPMDTVIDENNCKQFYNSGINVVLPRNVKFEDLKDQNYFYSYGLDEVIDMLKTNKEFPSKILIDVANGHMLKLYETSKEIKERFKDGVKLMVGNIANPETYRKYCNIKIDYIRVGIGGGSACLTSANGAIHYPMASLIKECGDIADQYDNPTQIIADGGFKNYSDIIKALALGAHSVMLGGVFNKCLEACGENYVFVDNEYIELEESRNKAIHGSGGKFTVGDIIGYNSKPEQLIGNLYKKFRGMSTKEVQKDWNRKELKTSEGIVKYNKVEYTLDGWVQNFTDYLKSTMSYCGKRDLDSYIGNVDYIKITNNAFNRFNK